MYKREYEIMNLLRLKHYLFIHASLLKEIVYGRKEI